MYIYNAAPAVYFDLSPYNWPLLFPLNLPTHSLPFSFQNFLKDESHMHSWILLDHQTQPSRSYLYYEDKVALILLKHNPLDFCLCLIWFSYFKNKGGHTSKIKDVWQLLDNMVPSAGKCFLMIPCLA